MFNVFRRAARAFSTPLFLVVASVPLVAQNYIVPGAPVSEFPGFQTLNINLPISGDDNRNSTVTMRYRAVGSWWRAAQPLLRVMPETVRPGAAVPSFAGAIFDLRPGTRYEVELNIKDPDGGGAVLSILADTRKLPPALPANPRFIRVTTTQEFHNAFSVAEAGDVITLAPGVYHFSEWYFYRTGTPDNPIIIRGEDRDRTILDGDNCECILVAVAGGGNAIFEDLTIQNVARGFRIVDYNSNIVFRRIHSVNVYSPIYSNLVVSNVTVMDSVLDGPNVWPQVNGQAGANQDYVMNSVGIGLSGSGHVIAHNRIRGFGDGIEFYTWGHRGVDIYGNDFLDSFDNAIELDECAGNCKFYRNRITNAFMPISVQPVLGGPAYIFRNALYNVYHETIKFHAVYSSFYSQSSGVFAYHNTAVNAGYVPLGIETPDMTHNFRIENNIFLGRPISPYSMSWGTPVDKGVFDFNLYFPDAPFWWKDTNGWDHRYSNLAALKAAPEVMERNGMIASSMATLGLAPLLSWQQRQSPRYITQLATSPGNDRAQRLDNINDGFTGYGADLGAYEYGCELPWYGPRPSDLTEVNQLRGCERDGRAKTGSVQFVKTDIGTKGDWRGVYGADGTLIAGDSGSASIQVATVKVSGNLEVWQANTTDPSALVASTTPNTRVAAGWTTHQDLYLDVTIPSATGTKQVAIYFAEWLPTPARQLEITVVDRYNRILYNTTLDSLGTGAYMVWNVTGDVRFRVSDFSSGGAGALINGVFIQPASSY